MTSEHFQIQEFLELRMFLKCGKAGFPCGSAGKESAHSAGDLGSIPGVGRSPGEGKGYPLQYSGLEDPMDYIVHGVTKSQTRLSNSHFTKDNNTYYATKCLGYIPQGS